ncbi:hypothetical protein [Escherichia coli]
MASLRPPFPVGEEGARPGFDPYRHNSLGTKLGDSLIAWTLEE